MEPTQAYRQGKEAFYMFKKNQNPYIKNTPQFNDWNKGYDDEAKVQTVEFSDWSKQLSIEMRKYPLVQNKWKMSKFKKCTKMGCLFQKHLHVGLMLIKFLLHSFQYFPILLPHQHYNYALSFNLPAYQRSKKK